MNQTSRPAEGVAPAPVVVLASASPRRRAMLAGAGVPVRVRATDIPETPGTAEAPDAFARRVAVEKAQAGRAARHGDDPPFVLACDTVVTLDGRILGKPASTAEATEMLRALSGRTHEVVTAFALAGQGQGGDTLHVGLDRTRVTFRTLDADEIGAYVESGEPMDKAGGYGIQGLAGAFVTEVDGAYDTVVGLPVLPVLECLEAARVIPVFSDPLQRRLAVLRARIAAACQAVARDPAEVTLIAVSKTQPTDLLRRALALGLHVFGENYVQEWREKAAALGEGPEWHFIGHLQSNKVKYLAPSVSAVHTLDSNATAEQLDRSAAKHARTIDVLVQVNLGGEAQKSGVAPRELGALLVSIAACPNLLVRGLMTVPPDGPLCASRAHFGALRRLRDRHATAERPLSWLSMGMSGDFDQAIAEGATHIRVGTALFGTRLAGVAPTTLSA